MKAPEQLLLFPLPQHCPDCDPSRVAEHRRTLRALDMAILLALEAPLALQRGASALEGMPSWQRKAERRHALYRRELAREEVRRREFGMRRPKVRSASTRAPRRR